MRLIRKRPTLADGFTLIELLIVMSLIVVLSSVALVGYQNSVVRAREATLMDDLHKLREAIYQYYADQQKWQAALQDLVTDGYVRKIPDDPMTNSADTWQTVPAESDPANPTAEPGIFDVKSGSDKTSLDGKAYAEW
ncbi:MAG: prepilin-type N-terminal cleavage/methylation domain-containing protein [Acidobacteria bacterium]|nr:prepilin-type N-terminal cleavage/methylation domain-containing protein [Acidobacteriota bacterium]